MGYNTSNVPNLTDNRLNFINYGPWFALLIVATIGLAACSIDIVIPGTSFSQREQIVPTEPTTPVPDASEPDAPQKPLPLDLCVQVKLPDQVTVSVEELKQDYPPSYFGMTLSDVPTGYSIKNIQYRGWCVDSRVFINMETYTAIPYSSCDPLLASKCPTCVDDEQWDRINYMLNQDLRKYSATYQDIQNSMWFFADLDPDLQFPRTDAFYRIINESIKRGKNFFPQAGQNIAIILYISEKQLIFLELPTEL